MDWVAQYQLFLFDFDGLLVDTEQVHFASYREICARYGYALPWDFEQFCKEAHQVAMGVWLGIGREFPEMFTSERTKEALYEEKKQIYVEMLQETRLELMPGAESLLSLLENQALKRAVVTNSPKEHIDIIKQLLPVLQTIPHWVTREQYTLAKPSPEGYLKAIEMLASPGDKIIGFEDSFKGLKALLAAGVDAVLVCPEGLSHVAPSCALGAKHFPSLSHVNI